MSLSKEAAVAKALNELSSSNLLNCVHKDVWTSVVQEYFWASDDESIGSESDESETGELSEPSVSFITDTTGGSAILSDDDSGKLQLCGIT